MAGTKRNNNDLKSIPGIGKNIEQHLHHIGIETIEDLKGKDPEELYVKDCLFKGFQEDRCILYVFRLAVYYAEHETPDPEKLKWWYWKDKKYPPVGYSSPADAHQQMENDFEEIQTIAGIQ